MFIRAFFPSGMTGYADMAKQIYRFQLFEADDGKVGAGQQSAVSDADHAHACPDRTFYTRSRILKDYTGSRLRSK